MNAFKRDRLSSRAFRTRQARLCHRCHERWTVNGGGHCPGCIEVETKRIQAELAEIEGRQVSATMPLFDEEK